MKDFGAGESTRGGSNAVTAVRGRQIFTLAVLSTAGQVSTFIYLPSLPVIAAEFAAGEAAVQLTLTAYLVGSCVSLLAYGPLSDRYGRIPMLLWGTAIYAASSIACALAGDVATLTAARFAQGIGATAGPVLARAMARDLCSPAETAKVLANMSMVQVLAPMAGPGLGAVIHETLGWRANFAAIAIIAGLALVLTWRLIGETNHARSTGGLAAMARSYPLLLRARAFIGPVLVGSSLTGAFFAFMAGAPFVFMAYYGAEPNVYGWYVLIIFVGFLAGPFAAGRRVVRDGIARTAAVGAPILALGAVALVVAEAAGVLAILAPMTVAMFGMGFMVPTNNAAAVSAFPEIAGAAAVLLALTQLLVGAAASVLVGVLANGTPLPMVLIVDFCSLAAVGVWRAMCAAPGPRQSRRVG